MGVFVAAYLMHAVRVAFAAVMMILIGAAIWSALCAFGALAGIRSEAAVLVSLTVIAIGGIAGGSLFSVRHITPNSVLHPAIAAMTVGVLFVHFATEGDVGLLPVFLILGAAGV